MKPALRPIIKFFDTVPLPYALESAMTETELVNVQFYQELLPGAKGLTRRNQNRKYLVILMNRLSKRLWC